MKISVIAIFYNSSAYIKKCIQSILDPRGNNIQVQGLENSYILILVDGERLSTTPGGPIDFDRLTTANIKKIEVLPQLAIQE